MLPLKLSQEIQLVQKAPTHFLTRVLCHDHIKSELKELLLPEYFWAYIQGVGFDLESPGIYVLEEQYLLERSLIILGDMQNCTFNGTNVTWLLNLIGLLVPGIWSLYDTLVFRLMELWQTAPSWRSIHFEIKMNIMGLAPFLPKEWQVYRNCL